MMDKCELLQMLDMLKSCGVGLDNFIPGHRFATVVEDVSVSSYTWVIESAMNYIENDGKLDDDNG